MNQAVAIIVALHVLTHSVVGCCDHVFAAQLPSSGCSHCHQTTVAEADANQRHHGDQEIFEAHLTQGEHSCVCERCGITDREQLPLRGHNCPHASCYWLTSDGASTCSLVDFDWTPALAAPVTGAIASETLSPLSPEFDIGRLHSLPLRLHLAAGVLLI